MECALDQGNEIDHDRTHDEEKTGDDDEPLFDPRTTPNTQDRLHLSVVSQHMRRKSLKGLKLRLTLIVKATPPLWHSFLRHFHWVTHFLPQVPKRHLRRQRLKTQHRNVNRDKISCQLTIQEKCPHVLPHTLNHTPLIIRLQCFQVLQRTAHGFASGVISPSGPNVELGSAGNFPNIAVSTCAWCDGSCTNVCAHLSLRTRASTSHGASFQKRRTSLFVNVRTRPCSPLRAAAPAITLLARQVTRDVSAWYCAFDGQKASMPESAVLTTRLMKKQRLSLHDTLLSYLN